MKSFFIAMLSLALVSAYAEKVNKNGDFEKCKADRAGNLMPEGWSINKGLSKKYVVTVTKEKEDVHGGNFALETETEKGGNLFLANWQGIALVPGDTLDISVFAKGTGSFQVGYILYGIADGEKKDAFLFTVGSPKMAPNEDNYKKFTHRRNITKVVRNKKTYNKLFAYPVIITAGDSCVFFDDFAVNKKSKTATAAK